MSSLRLGKGGTLATWDLIYKSRRKILFAGPDEDTAKLWTKIDGTISYNSTTILEVLLREGRLPGYAVHNLNSVAPFRDLKVHDNGNDLSLSVRILKGGDIQAALTILGDKIRTYVDWSNVKKKEFEEKYEEETRSANGEDALETIDLMYVEMESALINSFDKKLQHLVDCAYVEALATNREEGGHTPDLKRAFGLWLWDWKYCHPEAKDLRKGYVELLALYHRLFTPEKNADLPAPNNKRELQKYVKLTEACIKAGKSSPIYP
ncbi:MAG: hypothetical protein EOM37_13790 [Proteobacteria bacterium]|nr:hypothetical protein [Pseudomonadota bacterium]